MDWGWWPIVHLRPSKDKNIDNAIQLKITLVFGTFGALFTVIPNLPMTIVSMLISLIICWVVFFIGYKFTFALAWNRRAARLQESKKNNS